MAVFPWQSTVQDQDGNAIASAQLTIRDGGPSGDVSTIFSDSAETPLANPFNATSDGFAQFWAASGTYYIEAESGGQTTDGWYVVLVGAAAGIPVELTATVAAGEAVSMDGALVSEATAAEYLGLAQAGGVATDTINVQSTGNFTLGTWAWTADEYVYLTNAGALTQTPPAGTHRRIGIATAPTIIALSAGPVVVETGGAGSENAIPALSDAGLLDYTMIEKAATGGAGAENLLVQADAGGEIDISFLGAVVDTSRQLTASGALTAGDAVALSAADTVNSVGLTAGTFAFSFATDTAALGVSLEEASSAFNSADGVICHAYIDTTGDDIYAVLGTVSGTTITYGSPTLISTGDYRVVNLAYDEINNVFVLAYTSSTATDTHVRAFTTTGVTVSSIGSEVSVRAQYSPRMSLATASTGNQFVVTYANFATVVYARAGSISGTTITLGAEITANSGTNNGCAIAYDPSTDKYVCVISDDGNNQLRSVVLSPTGTALSAGSPTNIKTVAAPQNRNSVVCSDSGQIFASCAETANLFTLATGTISGTTVTWTDVGKAFGTTGTGRYSVIGWNSTDDEFGVEYANVNAVGGSGMEFSSFTVSGGLLVEGTIQKLTGIPAVSSQGGLSISPMAFDFNSGVYSSLFRVTGTVIYEININPAASTSNAASFVGFAQETVADTETVDVAILGDINADQTGLTFGTDYFIASDGTLSAVDTGFGKVGRALSATEILVTKNTWSA